MTQEDSDSSGSDYEVERYVRPSKTRKTVNDDSADLLGNFDDEKRKEIFEGKYDENKDKNPSDDENDGEEIKDYSGESGDEAAKEDDEDNDDDDEEMKNDDDKETTPNGPTTNLTSKQLESLMRGASKANRYVLYVTNLNFDTVKEDLENYFSQAGEVKGVRIPKKRKGGFAFVEMASVEGYQKAFSLHNTELQGWRIKVQLSEGGKKKSANKKNIIRQKNRKLAEMRSEKKCFTKSGKYYDKTIKKEKAKDVQARKKWRKPAPKPA